MTATDVMENYTMPLLTKHYRMSMLAVYVVVITLALDVMEYLILVKSLIFAVYVVVIIHALDVME